MTYAGTILLFLLVLFLVAASWWLDSKLPTAEEEEAQGRRDMEELLKRANDDVAKRPHVRAGKPIY